jgi:hypothetical protein
MANFLGTCRAPHCPLTPPASTAFMPGALALHLQVRGSQQALLNALWKSLGDGGKAKLTMLAAEGLAMLNERAGGKGNLKHTQLASTIMVSRSRCQCRVPLDGSEALNTTGWVQLHGLVITVVVHAFRAVANSHHRHRARRLKLARPVRCFPWWLGQFKVTLVILCHLPFLMPQRRCRYRGRYACHSLSCKLDERCPACSNPIEPDCL